MIEAAPLGGVSSIHLFGAQITEVGERQTNQDALGEAQRDDLACYVMSDGAGGHEAGEIASKIVVAAVLEKFLKEASFGARALRSYINDAIIKVAKNKTLVQRQRDMSATVAAVLIDQSNRCALWAHLGDTRIYMFRDNMIFGLTKDHSLAQRFIDAGCAKSDQLRMHPQRSILFAAIGAEGETETEVTKEAVTVQDGDVFLICTDGFWEWVMEAEMEQTLTVAENAEQWLAAMSRIADDKVSAAKKPRDNYSAFTIWLREPFGGNMSDVQALSRSDSGIIGCKTA